MILILGAGTLAHAIKNRFPDSTIEGRPNFDFSVQTDCDRLIKKYPNPDYLINTMGCLTDDIWNNFIVNFVAPCYISSKYLEQSNCHVINISSASAWWVSYPELSFPRFSYNIAKESLSSFGQHANRILSNTSSQLTTIEPGKFPSKMNNHQPGIDIEQIVDCVTLAIEHKFQQMSLIK